MADYTFIEMKEWFYNNAPKIINEKYFLYVMGSIFLLGIFTKWLAAFGYGRMIRKAEHMYERSISIWQICIGNRSCTGRSVCGTVQPSY